ncbi:ABC transporter, ATP-binding protein [Geomicrobium sp. JCM 19037]|uniref:ABC transporter ATP-binding protein n=1 Tax=Geomicrobium sp. JCM 19037 TaxID=1460634 RepID=UPI00045F4940|nr:ATP-binding cassette domain-containing protein [Geomicrobium sp. JCM 19037]GAK06081.1 ABC transporter, ATP-binding protein [Geomicrobium sp. JCM 19037]
MSLQIQQVTKRFGSKTALHNISFTIERGEMFGLLGSNGAGKTTTFRLIIGLLKASVGDVLWDGRPVSRMSPRTIGYLPEERGLYPKLKVMEQLIYLGRLRGMSKQEVQVEASKWLSRFQAEQYKNIKIEQLSKGNQQKVQFVAAVMHQPELLILDEPFSGLDPINMNTLKAAVLDLQKDGTTIVFSSHQMNQVESLCENLSILKDGEQVVNGRLGEVKANYKIRKLRVRCDFDIRALDEFSGVIGVSGSTEEKVIEITSRDMVPVIFDWLQGRGVVTLFELEEPTLHDIFVDKAGGR